MTAERIYGMNSDDSIKTRYGGLGAELAVASMFVDGGWNVYTPHRDVGTDFIATKACGDRLILRPVQVKGCYLRSRKDTATYGRRDMELGEQLLEQPGWSTLRVDARGVAQPLVAAGAQKWRAPELE